MKFQSGDGEVSDHPVYFRGGDNSRGRLEDSGLCFIKHFDHSAKKEPRQP